MQDKEDKAKEEVELNDVEQADAPTEAEPNASSTEQDKVEHAIAEKDAQIAELTADLQRTRADFENYRRQNDLQREQYANSAKYATVSKILPLIDDFERAIAAQPKELKPLEKNLEKTLKNLGLTYIESKPGTEFNPDLHNAISVEGDGEQELIAETLQSGFYYDGEVLRAALVRVSKQ